MVQLRVGEGCHEKDLETHIYKPVGVKILTRPIQLHGGLYDWRYNSCIFIDYQAVIENVHHDNLTTIESIGY